LYFAWRARAQPTFGWQKTDEVTLELHVWPATGVYHFNRALTGKTRLEVRAEAPVTFALAQSGKSEYLESRLGNLPHSRKWEEAYAQFQTLPCSSSNVLTSNRECSPDGEDTVVLYDERPVTDWAQNAAAAVLGSKQAAERASKNNRITIGLYQWRCVEDCASTSP
jgi:hypothetical protein